jgi:hypothetical protein
MGDPFREFVMAGRALVDLVERACGAGAGLPEGWEGFGGLLQTLKQNRGAAETRLIEDGEASAPEACDRVYNIIEAFSGAKREVESMNNLRGTPRYALHLHRAQAARDAATKQFAPILAIEAPVPPAPGGDRQAPPKAPGPSTAPPPDAAPGGGGAAPPHEALSDLEQAILDALKDGKPLQYKALAKKTGYARDTIRHAVPGMTRRGLLKHTSDGYQLP